MNVQQTDNVAIFWDVSALPAPRISGFDIVASIREFADQFGCIKAFRFYFDLSDPYAPSPNLRSELQCSGVTVVDTVSAGRKGASTKMMIADWFVHALDNPSNFTFIIISSDPDISYGISLLRMRNQQVILTCPPRSHPNLIRQSFVGVEFVKFFKFFEASEYNPSQAGHPTSVPHSRSSSPDTTTSYLEEQTNTILPTNAKTPIVPSNALDLSTELPVSRPERHSTGDAVDTAQRAEGNVGSPKHPSPSRPGFLDVRASLRENGGRIEDPIDDFLEAFQSRPSPNPIRPASSVSVNGNWASTSGSSDFIVLPVSPSSRPSSPADRHAIETVHQQAASSMSDLDPHPTQPPPAVPEDHSVRQPPPYTEDTSVGTIKPPMAATSKPEAPMSVVGTQTPSLSAPDVPNGLSSVDSGPKPAPVADHLTTSKSSQGNDKLASKDSPLPTGNVAVKDANPQPSRPPTVTTTPTPKSSGAAKPTPLAKPAMATSSAPKALPKMTPSASSGSPAVPAGFQLFVDYLRELHSKGIKKVKRSVVGDYFSKRPGLYTQAGLRINGKTLKAYLKAAHAAEVITSDSGPVSLKANLL